MDGCMGALNGKVLLWLIVPARLSLKHPGFLFRGMVPVDLSFLLKEEGKRGNFVKKGEHIDENRNFHQNFMKNGIHTVACLC